MKKAYFFIVSCLLIISVNSCGNKSAKDDSTKKIEIKAEDFLHHPLPNHVINFLMSEFFGVKKSDTIKTPNGEIKIGWRADKQYIGNHVIERLGSNIITEPILDTIIELNSSKKFIFVTNSNSPNNDCHACAPLISTFIFTLNNGKWEIENKKYELDYIGTYGKPYHVEALKLGPEQVGVVFTGTDGNQGFLSTTTTLYSIFNKDFIQSFKLELNFDSRASGSATQTNYSSTYKLIPGKNPDYYDISVKWQGKNYDFTAKKYYPMDKTERYIYTNGKYKLGKGI
jgi:hypothetical protein